MSRVVQVTEEVTANPSSYDDVNSVYYANATTGIENGYNASDNSESYAQIYFTRGSQAETFFYYKFGLSIPPTATVNSVSCSVRVRCSTTNTTYVETRQVQLYSGTTTAKGTARTIGGSSTLSNVTYNLTTGTWTAEELNDARIRIYAKRGTTNTTTGYYVRFYGATLTVNYTYNQTQYEVSVTRHGLAGMRIQCTDGTSSIDVLDSNTSDSFYAIGNMRVTLDIYDPNSAYAGAFVVGGNINGKNILPLTNPSTDNYAYMIPDIGSDVEFHIFEPLTVELVSNVQAIVYNECNAWYYYGNKWAAPAGYQVYTEWSGDIANHALTDNGTDVKSSASYGTAGGQYVIDNIQADHTVVIGTGDAIHIKVNGIWKEALEVYVKVSGTWQTVGGAYKKVNGAWVQQSGKSAMFDPNALYLKG